MPRIKNLSVALERERERDREEQVEHFCHWCEIKVKQSRYTPWRLLVERRYSSYSFSTLALDGGEWSASRPGRAFTPGERTPGTHWTGGWVGSRAGLDTEARGKISSNSAFGIYVFCMILCVNRDYFLNQR
jgi:hypothetical protein